MKIGTDKKQITGAAVSHIVSICEAGANYWLSLLAGVDGRVGFRINPSLNTYQS